MTCSVCDAVYRVPLFDPAELVKLRLLPTEYVYYYDQPQRAFDNVRRAGQTRAQAIAALTDALFERLRDPSADAVTVYRTYLRTRSAGYMQIESGNQAVVEAAVAAPSPASELSGYDKIALSVVRAIHFNTSAVIPLERRQSRQHPRSPRRRRRRGPVRRERQRRAADARRHRARCAWRRCWRG